MNTAKTIPWHHKDSDYVPYDSNRSPKAIMKIVRETPVKEYEWIHHNARPKKNDNDDPFVFGNRPFDTQS